jgi:type IV secretory pathway TraG/TraD family ATPase VirD4
VGKTTLLRNMIIADLCSGVGLTVIDPHGGLIDEILSVIPRCRTNDVIYFNPAERDRIIGLNVLESVRPDQRHLVVSSVISIMRHTWPDNWGPRSEWVLEHATMALLESPEPATLGALPRLLTDADYRAHVLANVTDPAVRSFFAFYEKQNDRLRDESIAPLLNKVSKFTTHPLLRAVIGQARSSFDFRWLMDNKKILLVNLSKGALGESASSLLGSLIVTKLALASLSRQDTPEEKRLPHLLYVDEAHNFGYGVDFPTILSESRKYRLGLIIGTQTLSQLSESTVAAIFGNVATIGSYRVSHDDAQALVRHFAVSGEGPKTAEQWHDTVIPASELQNLPDHKFYFQTLVNGRPHDPVCIDAFPPIEPKHMLDIWKDKGRTAKKEHVIRVSGERFGRKRDHVETEILRFLSAA